jgi:hypothetical protein
MLPPIGLREVAMTEKQQQAVAALEAARQEGVTLTAYAKAKGLVIGELYSTLAGLRRKGVLPRRTRMPGSRFVAVRVQAPAPEPAVGRAPGSSVLCRIAHPGGFLIECTQWPPPSWLNALTVEPKDAAI